jgi:hypothetical protein
MRPNEGWEFKNRNDPNSNTQNGFSALPSADLNDTDQDRVPPGSMHARQFSQSRTGERDNIQPPRSISNEQMHQQGPAAHNSMRQVSPASALSCLVYGMMRLPPHQSSFPLQLIYLYQISIHSHSSIPLVLQLRILPKLCQELLS